MRREKNLINWKFLLYKRAVWKWSLNKIRNYCYIKKYPGKQLKKITPAKGVRRDKKNRKPDSRHWNLINWKNSGLAITSKRLYKK